MNDAMASGWSARVLAGPLSLFLGVVALVLLGVWVPQYLSWPYWADHDVFANAARAWDRGERPYLDIRQNNFPGTIYAFYGLGKLVGWGRPWSFYAIDAALVATLAIALPLWSRRAFGRVLPGLVGSVIFLRYYESLAYWLTAQRDWQGPALVVLGLLLAQGWPGRSGRVGSAGLAALAFSIRPQTVLLWPALILAVASTGEPGDRRSTIRRGVVWLAIVSGFIAALFLPLVVAGLFDDFLRSLRRVAYGSKYNQVGLETLALGWIFQPGALRWLAVAAAILRLARSAEPATRTIAWPWLVALAGVSIYRPISPMPHQYLEIPLAVVGSVAMAVLTGLLVGSRSIPLRFQLLGVVSLLALGASPAWPEWDGFGPDVRAVEALRQGVEPEQAPPGYRVGSARFGPNYARAAGYYRWADYRATLLYLRTRTAATTRVANALKGNPAIVAAVDRPSAFPAESIGWLMMVNGDDEPEFVEALERASDSVVVWSPGEVGPVPSFQIPRIEAAIRRLYEPDARFGAIEVWRRRGERRDP